MNLPNKLTMLRVFLIPLFVWFMLTDLAGETSRYIALAIFIVASLTDLADGKIARKYNLVTNFGKFMDPLADKLLVCSALICLIQTGQLPAWYVIIIIAREFIISGLVIAASYWGKFKTTSQMILIVLLILNLPALAPVAQAFYWIALALTIISLADYIKKNFQVLSQGGF